MRVQVLITMGQDWISREETRYILDQWIYVVTMTQELCDKTKNFVQLLGEYIRKDGPLSQEMATWPHHIDRFKRKYGKVFAGNCLFVSGILDRIHNSVQVFIHSCNMTSIHNSRTSALLEFGKLQRQVEWEEWVTSSPPG